MRQDHPSSSKRIVVVTSTKQSHVRLLLNSFNAFTRVLSNWRISLDDSERCLENIDQFFDMNWDGVVSNVRDDAITVGCKELSIPCVDFNDETASIDGIPKVRPDNRVIGHTAAEHLRQQGLSHFAFCGFAQELWSQKREEGFKETMDTINRSCEVFNIDDPDAPKMPETFNLRDFGHEESELIGEWVSKLPKPVGIMACNDYRAVQVLDACVNLGIKVPDDVSIVGVNNDTIRCELRFPTLSSVPINAASFGETIAETLESLLTGKSDIASETLIEPLDVVTRLSSDALAIPDPLIARAVRAIRKHHGVGINVEELAHKTHSSRSQLERGFRKHLGHSPQVEIRNAQIAQVKRLLAQSKQSINDIALGLGFQNPEYLNVVFKKITGETPGAFRERAIKNLELSQ